MESKSKIQKMDIEEITAAAATNPTSLTTDDSDIEMSASPPADKPAPPPVGQINFSAVKMQYLDLSGKTSLEIDAYCGTYIAELIVQLRQLKNRQCLDQEHVGILFQVLHDSIKGYETYQKSCIDQECEEIDNESNAADAAPEDSTDGVVLF